MYLGVVVGEEVAIHREIVVAGPVKRPNSELASRYASIDIYYSLKPLVPHFQVSLALFFCSDGQIRQLLHGPSRLPEFPVDMLAEGIECVNNRVCEGLNPAVRDRIEAFFTRKQEQ